MSNSIDLKMKVLNGLKIPSLVQIDGESAQMTINSDWSVKIIIYEKSIKYEAISKGKTYDPKTGLGIPADIKGVIEALEEKYNTALRSMLEGEEEYTDSYDALKEGGFEFEVKPGASEDWKEVKEIEDKKAIEAKAKADREANLKKLEMAEKEEEFEASMTGNNSGSKPVSDNAIFTERPVEYVEAPAPKNGVVNLYDVLNKICKHDLMQVFGNTGTGKTSLCTKLALDARAKGKSVMYIDTEGSINDDQIEAMKKTGTKYEFIKQFQKLCDTVKRLPKVNVLIVDSAGVPALAAYCKANMGGQGEILKKFIAMSDDLKTYATENNALVVVINQPESSMSKGENAILEPFGEKSRYYYKEILKTNYAKRGRTTAKTTLVLSAHRSRCMGIDTPVCTMEVTNDGVTVIQ